MHRIRTFLAWALLLLGISALGAHGGEFERMDAWGWVALVALSAAPLVGFSRRPALRWLLASIAFWIFGNAVEWMLLVAVGLVIVSLVKVALVPTLVGRRVKRQERTPLAHLASGLLAPVAPQVFPSAHRSRVIRNMAIGLLVIAVALVATASRQGTDEIIGLAVAAVIMSATFFFANWFADRVRLRVDGVGVHGRMMFIEHTAKWTDITGLRLRYLFMPGYGVRLIYYVVESAESEVAFPSSMAGAGDLQACIEAATGLRWPEPEITANM